MRPKVIGGKVSIDLLKSVAPTPLTPWLCTAECKDHARFRTRPYVQIQILSSIPFRFSKPRAMPSMQSSAPSNSMEQ